MLCLYTRFSYCSPEITSESSNDLVTRTDVVEVCAQGVHKTTPLLTAAHSQRSKQSHQEEAIRNRAPSRSLSAKRVHISRFSVCYLSTCMQHACNSHSTSLGGGAGPHAKRGRVHNLGATDHVTLTYNYVIMAPLKIQ